jgi:hypothetical protein
MRLPVFLSTFLASIVVLAALAGSASAQATRTWVSGVGDDVNPCSRTAPCKTFAGAISKTAAGGTISVLDPAGYGAVTITKAISIQSDPGLGSILNVATNGIIINAGASDSVFISGLIIDGSTGINPGVNGVRFIGGKSLVMRDCIIRGNLAADPNGSGFLMANSAGNASALLSNCLITSNRVGVQIAPTGGALAKVTLDRVVIEGSTAAGVLAGQGGSVRLTNTVITRNAPGLSVTGNGKIISLGNNTVINNNPDGAPTDLVPLQ